MSGMFNFKKNYCPPKGVSVFIPERVNHMIVDGKKIERQKGKYFYDIVFITEPEVTGGSGGLIVPTFGEEEK